MDGPIVSGSQYPWRRAFSRAMQWMSLQARPFPSTFTASGTIQRQQILSIEAFQKRNARCSNDTLMFRLLAACALACASILHAASPSLSGPLTAEELFRAAELGEARISPDGRHLGAIVTDDKDLKNLLVYDLKDYKPTGLRASGSFEISNFHWLGDARVVFNVSRNKVYRSEERRVGKEGRSRGVPEKSI